jgi:hypothetical protein
VHVLHIREASQEVLNYPESHHDKQKREADRQKIQQLAQCERTHQMPSIYVINEANAIPGSASAPRIPSRTSGMFGLPVAWFRRDRQKATNDQNGSGRLIRIQTAAMVDNRAVFPMSR